MKVHVIVLPRKVILDPQGKAIAEALVATGFDPATTVRAGRHFEIDVPASTPEEARRAALEMGRTLLANPIIEDFRVLLPGEAVA